MKIKGVVLREPKKPYTIEEMELEPPKAHEVLVRYVYAGYCHSDLHLQLGEIPIALPLAAGHEGAGVVEEVGPGVTTVKKGDHVGVTWMIPCGVCPQCRRGMGNVCSGNFGNFLQGMLLDGTSRIKDKKGELIRHGNFVSCFSNYSVVPETGVIPMPKNFPLQYAALMGCCVPTGWGTVWNTAKVQPGDSVAVWGLGGVGLNVLRACVMQHAYPVFAIDLEESKASLAKEFGATHFICNSKDDPVPIILKETGGIQTPDGMWMGGGVQYAFEAIGDPGAIIQAWWSTCIAGRVIVPGITPFDQTTNIPLMLLPLHQKAIMGNLYGSISTHVDIPRLVNMAMKEDLKLDKLVTNKFKMEQINDVAEKMHKRQIMGRWVMAFD
jgi:S-(hydroxymethyl)glutathione dehydrogenase/alcohol dehydrogenase